MEIRASDSDDRKWVCLSLLVYSPFSLQCSEGSFSEDRGTEEIRSFSSVSFRSLGFTVLWSVDGSAMWGGLSSKQRSFCEVSLQVCGTCLSVPPFGPYEEKFWF